MEKKQPILALASGAERVLQVLPKLPSGKSMQFL
jgi:hypothetical protein